MPCRSVSPRDATFGYQAGTKRRRRTCSAPPGHAVRLHRRRHVPREAPLTQFGAWPNQPRVEQLLERHAVTRALASLSGGDLGGLRLLLRRLWHWHCHAGFNCRDVGPPSSPPSLHAAPRRRLRGRCLFECGSWYVPATMREAPSLPSGRNDTPSTVPSFAALPARRPMGRSPRTTKSRARLPSPARSAFP